MIHRTRTVFTAAAIALAFLTSAFVHAQETFRYVDMSTVFKNYYKTVRSQKSLKKQEDIYKERAEQLSEEIQKLRVRRDELDEKALNVAISEEERNKSRRQAQATENLYQAKQKQLRNFLQQKQGELRGQYMDMRKDLVDEILKFIQDYAKRSDIDTVFDVSGLTNNLLPVVIHYPEEKDITELVLKELNKGHEDEVPAEGVEAPDLGTE